MKLIEKQTFFDDFDTDKLLLTHTQEIPDWHLDELAAQRNASSAERMGDFVRVASVPEAMVDKWMAEGFNIYTATAAEITARLRAESAHKFLTTDKRV